MRTILLLSLILGVTALSGAENAYPDIALADLQTAIKDKKVVVIDANGSKSYAEGHIPGAIDFETARTDLAGKLPADKSTLIVAYCGGPKCHAWHAAAEVASKLGYTNIKHFSGGISGWKEQQGQVEKGEAKPADKDGKLGGAM
jgi:rhodanese-related sulfurtransferase